MSQTKNRVQWCLNKAKRELEQGKDHRGLVLRSPDRKGAFAHLDKANHYLRATVYNKEGGFSDVSASTVFYSMYHCLLAIAIKFGYESRNQECTFALIASLIEDKKISFDKEMLDKIALLDVENSAERTSIKIREQYQYGTSTSMEDKTYEELYSLAQEVIENTKRIIEE